MPLGGVYNISGVIDIYDTMTGQWSTMLLDLPRYVT
jgi:hypothetical protein